MGLKTLICKIRGHDWRQRPVAELSLVSGVVGVCGRCGETAQAYEAAGLGNKVLGWLLDQSDVDALQAQYCDGEISRDELEQGLESLLEDERCD